MMQILIFELTSRGLHPVRGTHRSGPIYGNVALLPFVGHFLRDVSVLSYNLCHPRYSERAREIHATSCCSSVLLCKHEEVIPGWRGCLYNSLPDDPILDKRRIVHTRLKVLAVVSTAAVKLPLPNYAVEFRTPS